VLAAGLLCRARWGRQQFFGIGWVVLWDGVVVRIVFRFSIVVWFVVGVSVVLCVGIGVRRLRELFGKGWLEQRRLVGFGRGFLERRAAPLRWWHPDWISRAHHDQCCGV
jgi:hypothetical protein